MRKEAKIITRVETVRKVGEAIENVARRISDKCDRISKRFQEQRLGRFASFGL